MREQNPLMDSQRLFRFSVPVLCAIALAGCAPSVHYVIPREWSPLARRDSIIQSFRPALDGRVIFLDPGHGGEDRVNRGPEGDAIEADVNLRVGLALREYLTASGARVIMSRDRDTSITLSDRPLMAVRAGAEIFVSLHHNATGTADQITNYASVYYHARPGLPGYHPASQDLARHIERDMSYAMRNPPPPYSPTFDGTLSDFDIYPNAGFAVLRGNPLPAALIEGSFFTHPPEEQRLAQAEFNQIEAWGIFLGLGKYFRSGFPHLALLSDTLVTVPRPSLLVGVTPWSEIDPQSIDIAANNIPFPWTLDDSSGTIRITTPRDLRSGALELNVTARTRAGKAAWPFRKRIVMMLPAASVFAALHPDTLPILPGAAARLVCSARDSNSDPVADGCPIRVTAPGFDTTLATSGGSAICYLPALQEETAVLVRCQKPETTLVLTARDDSLLYLSGTVGDSTLTLAGARVAVNTGGTADTTWPDGRFIVRAAAGDSLFVTRYGYYPSASALSTRRETGLAIQLRPVAQRRLFGSTFLIDPRYGGAESGETNTRGLRSADVNLEIAWRLAELLKGAGANVHLVRSKDTTIAETERSRRSALYGRGMYIRIDAGEPAPVARAEIYRSIPNRRLAERMLAALARAAHIDTTGVKASTERFFNDVAMGTVSLRLPSVTTGFYDSAAAQVIDRIAWSLFGGILPGSTVSAPLQCQPGTPARTLGGAFWQIPDRNGQVFFFGLEYETEILRSSP
jgi:N-acetylmuramoyl-L-alanine amidase